MGNLLIVEAKLLRRGWITANVGEIKGEWGMTRAIVDQKLSALLSAETRLARTLRTSPSFDDICAKYRKAEDEYNEAFDAWWWDSPSPGVVPEPSGNLGDVA